MQTAKRARLVNAGIAIGAMVCLLWIVAVLGFAQDVLISEIAWSGSVESGMYEWIELRSLSGYKIDLSGWQLVSDDGYPDIALSGTIPPFGYFLLERATDESVPCLEADQIYSGALRDSGETLRLINADNELVDVANPGGKSWPAGTDAFAGTPFSSMERVLPGLATVSAPWQSYRRDLDIPAPPCSAILGTPGRENSVENALPIATFTISPNPVHPGEEVLLDAQASVDPSGEIQMYAWIIDGETVSNEQTASVAFEEEGEFAITLTITDWKGSSESATNTLNVAWNSSPEADFSVGSTEENRAFVSRDTLQFADESTDYDGKIVSWAWDFGDGSHAYEQHTSHAYAESGVYVVTLEVVDDRGDSTQVTQSLTIQNLLPVAAFDIPSCTVNDGEIAILDASSSFDLDGTVHVYRWDFESDGILDLIQTGSATVEHPFAGGDHLITLQVLDDQGGLSLPVTGELTVNHPPVPSFAVSCPAPTQCQAITLDGTFSTDLDGTIQSWMWKLGDGTTAHGSQVATTYTVPGPIMIELTVVDDAGASRAIGQQVVISDLPPLASIAVAQAELPTGSSFSFDASVSTDPCDGQITLYEWDLDGDGTYEVSGTSCTASRAYDSNGSRNVSLRVTDSAGNTATATATVTVTNRAPGCRFASWPQAPDDTEQVTFTANATDPDGVIASVSWSFGDGTSAAGESVAHTFPDDGTYTVTMTVLDDDQGMTSCSQAVEIGNAAPVAAFEMSHASARVGGAISFNSLAYDPSPTGEIVHLAWDFGDGEVAFGQPSDSSSTNILSPSHAYDHSGSFVVSLAVIDEHGALSIATQVVTILE